MDEYLFYGVVYPERAQLSHYVDVEFSHVGSGATGVARISIILNQLSVWVDAGVEWNIFDLRNVVNNIVLTQLAMIGYLKGYSYDLEVTRVLNRGRGIDHVFGIDFPNLAKPRSQAELNDALAALRPLTEGRQGVLVQRCLNDLISAMKHADDSAFFCYRAIESLRHHCAAVYGISDAGKADQWRKFREVSACTEESLLAIKEAADPLRHGEASAANSSEREQVLTSTWRVVDAYLLNAELERSLPVTPG